MATAKLLNIFALSTLAVLLCSFAPSQTLALSIQGNHLARQIPSHHGIAKKKKRDTQRCKPKPATSSPPVQNTPAPSPSNSPAYLDSVSSSTSSSQPPAATNPPATTPSGSGKLGIAWGPGAGDGDPRFAILLASSRVTIFHLWSADISDALKSSGKDVSIMLWGLDQDRINRFVQQAQPGYAKYAYGYNEYNEPGQANIPIGQVGQAVDGWYKYLRPLANQGYTLGSPVASSRPDGFDWMTAFLSQCGDDCHVDEMPLHWYDIHFADFQTYINLWAGFKKPMRITEFACTNMNDLNAQPSMDDIWQFTGQAIPYLEGNPQILSYAPYGFMTNMDNVADGNRLFTYDTTLTDLGWRYVNGY